MQIFNIQREALRNSLDAIDVTILVDA